MPGTLIVRQLGRVPYEPTWRAMDRFTAERNAATPDEVWLLEHPPVFTLGRAARREHVVAPGDIPVVAVDRGGQVTYHGPGQLVMYPLIDLRRVGLGVRGFVAALEAVVIEALAARGVMAEVVPGAPGVYVRGRKVAALGLRVRRGATFHGLALNVDGDLDPFSRIDPCGYRGLEVTCTRDEGVVEDMHSLGADLVERLAARLGHSEQVAAAATREPG